MSASAPHPSYDYAHRVGSEPLSWEGFGALARVLTAALASYAPTLIVGNARGGLFPATAVACALRLDMRPVRLTRRDGDTVVRDTPSWKVDVTSDIAGQVVAVVDEMASSGATLALLAARVRALGAARVITASLYAHSWVNPMPDVVARVSDALVIFPWDAQVYDAGAWRLHPEYAAALALQTPRTDTEPL